MDKFIDLKYVRTINVSVRVQKQRGESNKGQTGTCRQGVLERLKKEVWVYQCKVWKRKNHIFSSMSKAQTKRSSKNEIHKRCMWCQNGMEKVMKVCMRTAENWDGGVGEGWSVMFWEGVNVWWDWTKLTLWFIWGQDWRRCQGKITCKINQQRGWAFERVSK